MEKIHRPNLKLVGLDDTEEIALEKYVHTPTEAGSALLDLAELLYGTEGISSGSPVMDYFINPNRPGWTRLWIARPGEMKSTMLRIIAKTEARRIVREREHGSCVIYVSYEEAIDTQELLFLPGVDKKAFWDGMVEPSKIVIASKARQKLPIFWIGDSMKKLSPSDAPMSVNMVMAGISGIKKAYGLTPTVILWDYIQETQVDKSSPDRKAKVIETMGDVIRMCILLGIPIDIASQAKQKSLENVPLPIPNKGDSEYSFYPEQKAVIATGAWHPWSTDRDNPIYQNNHIKLHGWKDTFVMTPNLMMFRTSKARYNLQKRAFAVDIDPVELKITDLKQVREELSHGG